ncbi:hypothetical protein SMICM304S_00763 [Streptomyces microflavus]
MLSRARAYSGVCSRPGTACEEYSRITAARAEYAMNACDQSGVRLPVHVRPQVDQQVVRDQLPVEGPGQLQRRFRSGRAFDLGDAAADHVGAGTHFGLGEPGRLAELAHPGAEEGGHGGLRVNCFGHGVTSVPYGLRGKALSPSEARADGRLLSTERYGARTCG